MLQHYKGEQQPRMMSDAASYMCWFSCPIKLLLCNDHVIIPLNIVGSSLGPPVWTCHEHLLTLNLDGQTSQHCQLFAGQLYSFNMKTTGWLQHQSFRRYMPQDCICGMIVTEAMFLLSCGGQKHCLKYPSWQRKKKKNQQKFPQNMK